MAASRNRCHHEPSDDEVERMLQMEAAVFTDRQTSGRTSFSQGLGNFDREVERTQHLEASLNMAVGCQAQTESHSLAEDDFGGFVIESAQSTSGTKASNPVPRADAKPGSHMGGCDARVADVSPPGGRQTAGTLQKTKPVADADSPIALFRQRLSEAMLHFGFRSIRERLSRHITKCGSMDVMFPFEAGPMRPQLEVMEGVMAALERGKHAVLESPTGTGKTASVLCAALAWQAQQKQSTGKAPQIIFTSRTHSQLGQVAKELRTLPYAPKSLVMGSRESGLCVHPEVAVHRAAGFEQVAVRQSCRRLRQEQRCEFFKGVREAGVAVQQAAEAFQSAEVWDIEESSNFGLGCGLCPYYLTQSLSEHADLILCPYNYIFDPSVRHAVGFSLSDLRGKVVIVDEAHNIEGLCRETGSFRLDLEQLRGALAAVKRIVGATSDEGVKSFSFSGPLNENIPEPKRQQTHSRGMSKGRPTTKADEMGGFIVDEVRPTSAPVSFPSDRKPCSRGFSQRPTVPRSLLRSINSVSSLLGRFCDFLTEARESAVFAPHLPEHRQVDYLLRRLKLHIEPMLAPAHATFLSCNGLSPLKSGLAECQAEAIIRELLNLGAATPEGLNNASVLEIIAKNISRLAAVASVPEFYAARLEMPSGDKDRSLCFWLMLAEGTLGNVAAEVRSLVLMSGTLAPMTATLSELGPTFQKRLAVATSTPHVVDSSALRLVSVAHGSDSTNMKLECNFQSWKRPPFLRAVGMTLLQVVAAIPGGVLVFLPSFEILERCVKEWKGGEFSQRGCKRQRGAVERVFSDIGSGFGGGESIWDQLSNLKGALVVEPNSTRSDGPDLVVHDLARNAYHDAVHRDGGAVLFAVYRGRMSEGVSFHDDLARGVVCIGIPYPNLLEERLAQKRACNDFWLSQGRPVVSGDLWYEMKGLQAVAQAVGRCIRHPGDYGAVVLLDSRWAELDKLARLPQWLRSFSEETLDGVGAAKKLREHFVNAISAHGKPCRNADGGAVGDKNGNASVAGGTIDAELDDQPARAGLSACPSRASAPANGNCTGSFGCLLKNGDRNEVGVPLDLDSD